MATRPGKSAAPSVEAFLDTLDHPLLAEVQALRVALLAVDRSIGESIKWNAPSFFTSEHFATMRLNGRPSLQLILHLGAKKQSLPADAIADPQKLLKWLGADRACIDFPEAGSVAQRRQALQAIVRQWLAYVPK